MAISVSRLEAACVTAILCDIPLLIWGDSGIGKSTIVRSAFNKVKNMIDSGENFYGKEFFPEATPNEHSFQDLRLAHADISEWGIPRVFAEVITESGLKKNIPVETVKPEQNVVDYIHTSTRPSWLPNSADNGIHLIMIDELNRGDRWAINAIMELCAERSLRGRKLPMGARLISACNPPTGEFTTDEVDAAMKARWCHIHCTADAKKFIEDRYEHLDPISVGLINQENICKDANLLEDWSVQDQVEYRPRMWEMHKRLSDYIFWLSENDKKTLEENLIVYQNISEGLIGLQNSIDWWRHFNDSNSISLERILNGDLNYENIKDAEKGFANFIITKAIENNDQKLHTIPNAVTAIQDWMKASLNHRKEFASSIFLSIQNIIYQSKTKTESHKKIINQIISNKELIKSFSSISKLIREAIENG